MRKNTHKYIRENRIKVEDMYHYKQVNKLVLYYM